MEFAKNKEIRPGEPEAPNSIFPDAWKDNATAIVDPLGGLRVSFELEVSAGG